MKTFTTRLRLLVAIIFVSCATNAQTELSLQFNSGVVRLNTQPINEFTFSDEELEDGYIHGIVVIDNLNQLDKIELKKKGIELYDYLPKNAFYASINTNRSYSNLMSSINLYRILPEWKKTAEIVAGYFPDHALNANGTVSLEISVFEDLKNLTRSELITVEDLVITEETPSSFVINTSIQSIEEIAALEGVIFISSVPEAGTPINLPGKTSHGSSALDGYNSSGINYTGDNITVMMTDDGYIGEHIDFKGRYDQSACNQCSSSASDSHGDHVAGTIMGAGNLDPYAKGMAMDINFFVQDCANGLHAFWNNVPGMYVSDSLVLTSRSDRNGWGGAYTAQSNDFDEQMRTLPNLLHVCAAANEGDQDCGYGVTGWGNISDVEQAGKNPLVVGALDKFNNIAGFSSRGPLADGRIKPDICGVGVAVYSTQPDNNYDTWNGTSMSTPGVTGTLAQLYEAYRVNNGGTYPTGALMKAIVMNTADDLGNKGPDFIYGYGKINGRKALGTIENQTYFVDSVSTGDNESFFINVPPNVSELRVMLYWPDYEASVASAFKLVNNLNMSVIDPNSVTYLPWILDHTPSIPALSAPAVPGIDSLNNTEQVTIDSPISGVYEINIDGLLVPQGPQIYYVVYEFNYDEIHVNYPNGMEGMNSSTPEIIRWDALSGTNDFVLEYTLDNGLSWDTIGTVGPSQRYYYWQTPSNVATGLARVRVSRNGISDISDTTFSIINAPTNLAIDWACPDSLKFSWTGANGATGYEVSMLGSQFMEVYDTVFVDSIIVQVPATDTVWLSVATLGSNNAKSRRAVAIVKNPGEFNCFWSAPYAEFTYGCDKAGENYCFDLFNESINTDTATATITYYFPGGTPSVSTSPNATVCYSTAGSYDVAMVVDNGFGVDSIYLSNVFEVIQTPGLPYVEGFESYNNFLNLDDWSVYNPDNNGTWAITTLAANSGGRSARMMNFGQASGFIDELISGPIDLSSLNPATDVMTLSFRYAYRKKLSSNSEILKLMVRDDCESGWIVRKALVGSLLGNTVYPSSWFPQSEDWVVVHVTNITDTLWTNNFQMKFQFSGDEGNNLFIDDINIYKGSPSDTIVGIESQELNEFVIYPNPTEGELNISYQQQTNSWVKVSITDLSGKEVFIRNIQGLAGKNIISIDTKDLAEGMYMLKLSNGAHTVTERFIAK